MIDFTQSFVEWIQTFDLLKGCLYDINKSFEIFKIVPEDSN
jgi:hypothetical protein